MRLWVLCLVFLICITAFVEASGRTKIQNKDENEISADEESVEEQPARRPLRTAAITRKNKTKPKEETTEDEEEEVVERRTLKKNPKKKPKDQGSDEDDDDKKPWPICEPPKEKKQGKKGDDKKVKAEEKNTDKNGNKKDAEEKKDSTAEKDDDEKADEDDDEEACHCEMNDITCDSVIFDDHSPLDTLMLKIQDKNFAPLTFTSRENDFRVLSKDKIIPSIADAIIALDLSKNKIAKIDKEAFYNFKNMTKLKLSSNNLKRIDPAIFKGAPENELQKLYLDGNRFTELSNKTFSLLKNLKELVLDNARVPITKWLFEGLDNLEELSLDYCQLGDKNFDANVFDYLPNLKTLSLRGNHFTEVPKAIQKLKKLEILDISLTRISEFHKKSFMDDQSLKILYANNMTYLSRIDDCAFCDLNQLEELYFANSPQLWNINKNAFGYVEGDKAKNVKKIDLTNCSVETLYEETLPWGKNIELLLTENPINCTCDTAWLLEEEVYSFDQKNLMPKCSTPSQVKGKPLPIVQQSEVCKNIRKKKQGGRFLQAFVLLLLASLICFTFYYLVTSGKLINFLRPKTGVNLMYSNLSPTDEQPLERDFQPRAQEV